jgi:LysM domain
MSGIGDVLAEIRDFTWDLGGASGEVRSVAGMWRQLQADLLTEHGNLALVSRRLRPAWNDEAGTRAAGFIDALASAVRDQASQGGTLASSLDDAADRIDAANAQLHDIYLQIGIQLGIDLALQWVPFVDVGLDAATVARALLWLGRARTIVAELIAFLSRLVGLFVINAVSTFVIRAVERGIVTRNALNGLAWTPTDLQQTLAGAAAGAIPGAVIGARGGMLLSSLPRVGRLSVPLAGGLRLPLGALLRLAEPFPTYMLTAGVAGMGGSALNSVLDHQRPTWGQVLSAGAWSVAAAGLGAGTLTFASRFVSRGPIEWPGETQLKVGSGAPFSWISSNSRIGRIANWRFWSSGDLPVLPRTANGSVLADQSTRVFVGSPSGEVQITYKLRGPFEMTMGGLYVGTGSGAQRVRDLGIVVAPRGVPEYFPLNSALRPPPGTEPAFARPGAQMLVGNLFNLGFDVNPFFGPQVREAKHLAFQSAATNLGALPTVQASAPLAPPAPGRLARYVVRPGDTLWAIAARQYGYPTVYTDVAGANRIGDPGLIFPGQQLVLPAVPVPVTSSR